MAKDKVTYIEGGRMRIVVQLVRIVVTMGIILLMLPYYFFEDRRREKEMRAFAERVVPQPCFCGAAKNSDRAYCEECTEENRAK
jgi:hypothetical protein